MSNNVKWIVDFDNDPGYSSFSKSFNTEDEAKAYAEKIEKEGLYVNKIRRYDPDFFRMLELE